MDFRPFLDSTVNQQPSSGSSPGIVNSFLLRYFEDQQAGTVEPLERYQALFPGYEDLIAREYARLQQKDVAADDSDTLQESTVNAGPDLEVPRETIGPYKLVSILGKGGMGIVYLAEQTEPIQRRVALKLIKVGMDTSEVLARFQTERQALAMMNHPNIARVFDAGSTDEGRPYFVMEYVSGIPLTEYCDHHRLDTADRLRLIMRVCDGIQHAHQKGIIHRDLKPSNVLVTIEDGKPIPKIIDFGVAKSVNQPLSEKTLFTEQGQIIGTPEYMSPEQAEMTALDIDTRTDIYSIGVLLYELLVGSLPLDSRTLRAAGYLAVQRLIVESEPPKPSTRLRDLGDSSTTISEKRSTSTRGLMRDLRGDLDWITMKAMEKQRARRYASASELAADLERHLHHEPVMAGPPSLAYRTRKFIRKHRVSLAAGLTLLIMALSSYFITERMHFNERRAASAKFFDDAMSARQAFLDNGRNLQALESEWQDVRGQYPYWLPVWESHKLLEVRDRRSAARRDLYETFNRTTLLLHRALQEAPSGTDTNATRRALEDLYWQHYQESLREGELSIPPAFFKGLMGTVGLGTYEEMMQRGRVTLTCEPFDAEVFCFRYEYHDGHQFPVPFDPIAGHADPQLGRLGEPYLEIEALWFEGFSPFQVGDRWLSVDGKPVRRRSDLARALSDVNREEKVRVEIRRDGTRVEVAWTPFQAEAIEAARASGLWGSKRNELRRPVEAGTVLNIPYQFGFRFRGYPLDFKDGCRLGVARANEPFPIDLPRGSYLLVFQGNDIAETRYPVLIPRQDEEVRVRLLRTADVPRGFVYIPGGSFDYGGDSRESKDGLAAGRAHVKGFLVARQEVTFREYLEFLNDPEISASINDGGFARPRAQWDYIPALKHLAEKYKSDERQIRLIPRRSRRTKEGRIFVNLVQLNADTGLWVTDKNPDLPIFQLRMLAGLEYALWLRSKHDNKWRFRLPTDLEWEKTARGADRRTHVWGNDFFPSLCNSNRGNMFSRSILMPVGSFPLDESVYGVRDLAGSVFEATTDTTTPDGEYISRRGGHWLAYDSYFFRVATRWGRPAQGGGDDCGLRVFADLPD